MKLAPGQLRQVRYSDGAWYPARIIAVMHDYVIVRWDPLDPNIPKTYRVDDPEEDIR
jgi:hypothetical protein